MKKQEYVSKAKLRVRVKVYTPTCGCGRTLRGSALIEGQCSRCQIIELVKVRG